jgi:ketosteroid isomerase-like protein
MTARTPSEVHDLFERCFNAADRSGLLALFEDNAALTPQPGVEVQGKAGIAAVMEGFLALGGAIHFHERRVFAGDGVALLYSRWTLDGRDPAGQPVALAGTTSDVVRRQPDGSWLLALDNPYGGASAA